jgi:hypothetical protein
VTGLRLVTIAALAVGCASIPRARELAEGARAASVPLGPGWLLMPLGADDAALLGKMMPNAPEPGHALDETARANPCLDQLSPAREIVMASTFEDAEEIALSAKGRATLGAFGFAGEASSSTHFFYRVTTTKKIVRDATPAYEQCCSKAACGQGYVAELVYGEGEYAVASETSGSGSVDVTVARAKGSARLKLLRKRRVSGWFAARIQTVASKPVEDVSALGPKEAVLIEPESAAGEEKQLYERESIRVCDHKGSWAFCDGKDTFSEVEFAQRYRQLLAVDELRDVERRRNTAAIVGFWALGIGGLAAEFYGLSRVLQKDTLVGGLLMAGGIISAGGAVPLLIDAYANPAGSVTNHVMTNEDAKRYAGLYNRALWRKIGSDVKASREHVSRGRVFEEVAVTFGVTSLALSIRF